MRYFSSESVTEGHPDKLCDQISDGLLDEFLSRDKDSRCAIESLCAGNFVHVAGEVSSSAEVDVDKFVRSLIKSIGYSESSLGVDPDQLDLRVTFARQSEEIAHGVDSSLEARSGKAEDLYDSLGAGDQGIMFGFATSETNSLMPAPIWLAHRLAQQLSAVRKDGVIPYLRPDGKTQATVGFENGKPVELETVVISAQHDSGIEQAQLEADVIKHVVEPVLEVCNFAHANTRYLINPSGQFVQGGPAADAGLTGRKIIVDTYGGSARHGGGAFSGKDPTKVDRSAAYALRWVAKNVVAAGLATKAEIQVSYAIGSADPVSLFIETFGTETISLDKIEKAVKKVFDLRPRAIIEQLELLNTPFLPSATYGHFGREDFDFPWERINRVEDLRKASAS